MGAETEAKYWTWWRVAIGGAIPVCLVVVMIWTEPDLFEFKRDTMAKHAYDAAAQSNGRSAKFAETLYYQEHQREQYGYTKLLADLLVFDRTLIGERGVTFLWSYAGDTHYTFTTSHAKGKRTFVFAE